MCYGLETTFSFYGPFIAVSRLRRWILVRSGQGRRPHRLQGIFMSRRVSQFLEPFTIGPRRKYSRPRRGWTPHVIELLEKRRLLDGTPFVSSIDRTTPSGQYTSENSVTYTVTFTAPVTNVLASDFLVVESNGSLQGTIRRII